MVDVKPAEPERQIGGWFVAALVAVPYLAWWFLLRPGYSRRARLGWGLWLVFFVASNVYARHFVAAQDAAREAAIEAQVASAPADRDARCRLALMRAAGARRAVEDAPTLGWVVENLKTYEWAADRARGACVNATPALYAEARAMHAEATAMRRALK